MEIGIFPGVFVRPTLEETLDAVVEAGMRHVQINLSSAGLPDMPDRFEPNEVERLRAAHAERGIAMAAISGTYNMIHPNPEERRKGLSRLKVLAEHASRLGTSVIALCTGTRNPDSMWRPHPDNGSPEAWSDLMREIEQAVKVAEATDVALAFEPEVSNVVDSAQKARKLLDGIGSPRLKVVMDGANLYHRGELPRMAEILDEAFQLLGDDIVLAHAKDLDRDGEAGHLAAGTGLLDYDRYLAHLNAAGYRGPIILHSLTEAQVPECVAFLKAKLQALS